MRAASEIIGSWRVVRSDVDHEGPPWAEVTKCYVHFSPDGKSYLEYPLAPEGSKISSFDFRMTDAGVFISTAKGRESGQGWEVPFSFEGESLVFSLSDGRKSWLELIPANERPEFLKHFYSSPK